MGRTAIFELLPTHALPSWMKYARDPDKLRQLAKKGNYPDLADSYRTRIENFTTCPDYVMEVVSRTEVLS
jgi:type II secretory ATPase GspE/PulE/Tfp pilus assembly ATPase PilB-like protein